MCGWCHDHHCVCVGRYGTWDVSYHDVETIKPSAATPTPAPPPTPEIFVSNLIKTGWLIPGNTGGVSGSGARYYLAGVEQFLERGSGTFVHDAESGTLLYAPLGGAHPGSKVVVPRLVELVRSDSVTDLILNSVTFEHAGCDFGPCDDPFSRCEMQSADDQVTAAVHWTNSNRVSLTNVTVRHTGGYGVWFDYGCSNSVASRLHLYDLGAGGVRIGGGYLHHKLAPKSGFEFVLLPSTDRCCGSQPKHVANSV